GIAGSPQQDLEINVPSADDVYIARVRQSSPSAGGQPPAPQAPQRPKRPGPRGQPRKLLRVRPPRAVPGRVVADAASDTLDRYPISADLETIDQNEIAARMPDQAADHFETQTGFIIRGARLAAAAIHPRANSGFDVLNAGDSRGDAVRIYPGTPALPVIVSLQDGRSAI